MAYIYLITNKINGKQYVGKTENTIDERWKEHKQDYKKDRCEKRPLYDAMQKYGIENFEIRELEYLKEGGKILSDREEYWIEQLDTYHNGYNATKGGDGSTLYDYNKIIEVYNKTQSINTTAKQIGCDIKIVRKVLDINNIDLDRRKLCNKPKKVQQYSLTGELLNTFESCYQAGKYLKSIIDTSQSFEQLANSIGRCALGKRKTSYKYIWRYIEN